MQVLDFLGLPSSPSGFRLPLATSVLPMTLPSANDAVNGSTRRRFLQQLTVGAGAASLGLLSPGAWAASDAPSSGAEVPLKPTSAPQEVIVVGAGLAGLAAAWELEAAGHEVTILEAKSHPGGRVRTLREPFADGLYAEAGAVAFSQAYSEANRYIDELGLERADWARPDLPQLYHLNGERFAAGRGSSGDWPYDLNENEQGLGPFGLLKKYLFSTLPEAIATPGTWNQPPLSELDRIALTDYLREQGASEGAVELIADTQFFGFRMDRTSTLSSALAEFGLFFAGAPFVLNGGNDQLTDRMAEQLSGSIQYGVEVTGLRDAGPGVEVTAERAGQTELHEADRAICTVPLGVLEGLSMEPPLPAEKRAAIENIPYVTATRTFVQVERAFWYEEGVTGRATTDLPIGTIDRHPWADAAGPNQRAILEGYATGPAAARQTARPDDAVVEQVLDGMEAVHPDIREYVEGAVVKAWGRDPYALGHVSWPGPGDVTRHLTPLQEPHGRIHFGGEHTSVLRSTMEGALRSGIRAAKEVNKA